MKGLLPPSHQLAQAGCFKLPGAQALARGVVASTASWVARAKAKQLIVSVKTQKTHRPSAHKLWPLPTVCRALRHCREKEKLEQTQKMLIYSALPSRITHRMSCSHRELFVELFV